MFSIWSCVELNVAIFCSCAPTLKGLVQRVWPQFLASIGSRYGSARGSGRGSSGRGESDASGSTAVNSTTSSTGSISKPQDIAHVESQTAEKTTSSGFLGLRRSLFRPLFKNSNNRLSSCYGNNKNDDDDIMFDDVGSQTTRKVASSAGLHDDEKGIEVQTIVDQRVEPRAASPVASRPEEATKTMVSGAGVVPQDPFKDDQQDERDIQRAAWSS